MDHRGSRAGLGGRDRLLELGEVARAQHVCPEARGVGGEVDRQEAAVKIAAFQQALFKDIQETFEALKHQDDSGPLRAEDLPSALRHGRR